MNASTSTEIMNVIKEIEEKGFVTELGYAIVNGIDGFDTDEMGSWVINVFKNHPEHAAVLNEMLIAICDWSIGALFEVMNETEDFYGGD